MTGRPAMGRELTEDQGLGNRAANHAPKRKGAAGKPSTPSCFFGPEEAGKKLTSWLLPARPWRRRRLPGQRRQLRPPCRWRWRRRRRQRSEEHTSDLQSLMRISYAVFCLKKKIRTHIHTAPFNSTYTHVHNKESE